MFFQSYIVSFFEGIGAGSLRGGRRGGRSCRTCATPRKMDEVKLLMFNKVYHTFLSNPVKMNKKLHGLQPFVTPIHCASIHLSRMPSFSRVISLFLYRLPMAFLNVFLLKPKRSAITFGRLLSVTAINPPFCRNLSIIFRDRASTAL